MTIDSEVEEILQVYRKRILLEDDGLADIEATHAIKSLMLERKLEDAKKYKEYYDKKIAQEANKAQLEILRGFRRRDFVSGDMYEVAVLNRIAQLTADKEQA